MVRPGSIGPLWHHQARTEDALGWFGELHPRVLEAMDVKAARCLRVVLNAIRSRDRVGHAAGAQSLRPHGGERDFAFVLDEGVEAERVLKAARGADKALIEEVSVFDLFTGGNLGQGKSRSPSR